jgi:hypothetical protein
MQHPAGASPGQWIRSRPLAPPCGVVFHCQASLCRVFVKGSSRDPETSSDSFDLGMLRLLWNILGHAITEVTMRMPNSLAAPNPAFAAQLHLNASLARDR